MPEAGPIHSSPQLSPRELYAQEFDELSTPDLLAMKDFLGGAIGKIEDFSFDNQAHVDLRNRFLGSTLALRGRNIEEPAADNKKDNPDDEPPSYMLRVDGGVDVVSSAGVKAFEINGYVPADQILATHKAKAQAELPISAPKLPMTATPLLTSKRRVIV